MNPSNIFVLGTSHKSADIATRGKVAFNKERVQEFLAVLVSEGTVSEAVMLSTCNRTELYVVAPNNAPVRETLESQLLMECPDLSEAELDQFFFYSDVEAVNHLFMVTAGLDSMILGEAQIVGQVKDAIRMAQGAGTAQAYLNRLFHTALNTSKKVRSDTAISEGAVSVAYAAVELAQKIFRDLSRHRVLLIGAGETGQLLADNLRKKGVADLIITNRTFEKAQLLAERWGVDAVPFEDFRSVLPKVDLIIGSTSAETHVLTAADIKPVASRRSGAPLVMIDIAVPRDFDPAINKLDNVFLNTLDSLEEIVAQNLDKRRRELPAAMTIIEAASADYREWVEGRALTPTIVAMKDKLEMIRQAEIERHCRHLDPDNLAAIDRVTRGIVNKVMQMSMVTLRGANGHCTAGQGARVGCVREMFRLEESLD